MHVPPDGGVRLAVPRPRVDATVVGAGAGAQARAVRLEEQLASARAALAEHERRVAALEEDLRRWRAGAEGERLVADELDQLAASGWRVLHDVRWPGRPVANLDHVAVGPGGVVVVDTKNWSRAATAEDGVLRCGGYHKGAECEAVARMTADVAALLEPRHRASVRGAIALVRQDLDPVRVEPGAVVVGRQQLGALLLGLPPVLDDQDAARITDELTHQLATPRQAPRPRRARPARRPERAGCLRPLAVLALLLGLVATADSWLALLRAALP